jgi:glycosyltransferase A (GT-A) superfamily protein (DUF2064 family)
LKRLDKQVLYSEEINHADMWSQAYSKEITSRLGSKNAQRLQQGFADGYDKIVIIGSDLIALESDDIIAAIENLDNNDIVIVLQKMVAITFRNEKFQATYLKTKNGEQRLF